MAGYMANDRFKITPIYFFAAVVYISALMGILVASSHNNFQNVCTCIK
jgi:hypothetical protein